MLIPRPQRKGRLPAVVLEFKVYNEKKGKNLEDTVKAALQQIEEKDYMARLKLDGMRQFIKYGIACYKKDCKVMIGDES